MKPPYHIYPPTLHVWDAVMWLNKGGSAQAMVYYVHATNVTYHEVHRFELMYPLGACMQADTLALSWKTISVVNERQVADFTLRIYG